MFPPPGPAGRQKSEDDKGQTSHDITRQLPRSFIPTSGGLAPGRRLRRAMTREEWVILFVERSRDLRPYLSLKVVWAIGLVEYRADADPKKTAAA
jgi:hypothetical protein